MSEADVLDLIGHRHRDKDSMLAALETQDELRGKSSEWSGAEEVRRWRDERYSS